MELTARDRSRLVGLHPDLVRVVELAAERTFMRWCVFEGLRTVETQRLYFERKRTLTMNSRHLTGHAVDLVLLDGKGRPTWEPADSYFKLAPDVLEAATRLGVRLRWGGNIRKADGRRWFDGAHFELLEEFYPDSPPAAPVVAAPVRVEPANPPPVQQA